MKKLEVVAYTLVTLFLIFCMEYYVPVYILGIEPFIF